MTTIDTARGTPLECLAASDAAFAAGDYDGGSELLFQAAAGALSQLADDYGQPCGNRDELRAFAKWLDAKRGSKEWHTMNLVSALNFGDNAQYRYLPPEEMEYSRPMVRGFVGALLSYRHPGGAAQ